MKRIGLTLLSLVLALSLFAGGASEKQKSGVVKLEILLSDDTLEGGAMAKAVDRFNQEYVDKGIQAEINEVAYADIKSQIQNRATANDLPALIKTTHFEQYTDYIYPLDGVCDYTPDDFAVNGVRGGQFLGTPVNTTAVGMVINKTAFDKAGVSYPVNEEDRWTWDEFLAAVKKVVANSDCDYGLVVDHSQQRIKTILYQFGSSFADASGKKIIFDSPETRKALQFIVDLYKDGVSPVSVGLGTDNAQSVFKTGKAAAHLAGNWVITDYTANIKDFEWTPVLMPYEKEKATSLGGNWLYAFKGTGVEKEAVEFINWFYKPENYAQYCADGSYLPGRKNIDITYNVPGLEIFNKEINASSDLPSYDKNVEIAHPGSSYGNIIRDSLDRVIAGEITIDQMIDAVQKQIKDAYPDMSL